MGVADGAGRGGALLTAVEAGLVATFGSPPQRASVSFVGVEPIEVLRFAVSERERVYASLGMSRHPMTAADEMVRAGDGPRAELVLRVHDPAGETGDVWRRLAVLAAAPAVEGVVYVPGMSVELGEPLVLGSACTGVVVGEPDLADVTSGDVSVRLLPVLPATAAELAWSRAVGGSAMLARWREHSVDLTDLGRRAVPLA